MERLTKRQEDGQAVMDCKACRERHIDDQNMYCSVLHCRNRLKDRVADYEETGLEPWEIERIRDAYGRGLSLRTESAKRLEMIREIPTDRLRELVEADRDVRCVIITRCCECKHAKENKDTVTVFCHAFMRDMRGHDFCSYGEKSTDNSTDL